MKGNGKRKELKGEKEERGKGKREKGGNGERMGKGKGVEYCRLGKKRRRWPSTGGGT